MNSKPVILSLESLLKALKTKELFNINRLNLQPHLLYKTQHLKNLHAHVYIEATGGWSPAGGAEDRNYNRAFRSKVWVSNQIDCLLVLWKSGAVWL